jgi:pilus assembly protein Flp/PilA
VSDNSENQITERKQMNTMLIKLYVNLMCREEGQDLVEYALVVAIIALGATAAMKGLASAISTSFGNISTAFASAL